MEYVESSEERVSYEMARARRYGLPLTLVLVTSGESIDAQPQFHEEVANRTRGADIVKRFDEFCMMVLLPHTGLDGGIGFARRITSEMTEDGLTARAGVAAMSLQHQTSNDLVQEAVEALGETSADNLVIAFGETPIDSV